MGILVAIEKDVFYHRLTVTKLTRLADLITRKSRDGRFTAPAFRDRIGTGRKLAIEILEFFDRTGVTLREGDLRRVRPEA